MIHLKQLLDDRLVRIQVFRRVFLWTLTVAIFIGVGIYFSNREIRGIALGRARERFQLYLAACILATGPDSTYPLPDQKALANPHVGSVPNRRMNAIEGRSSTMGNLAYLNQSLNEMGLPTSEFRGHISSLKPIHAENAADAWEIKAFKAFESGRREYWEESPLDGQPQLRFMGALITAESCLRCHAAQGYKVGDLRGGISLTVPILRTSGWLTDSHELSTLLSLVLIWSIGIGVILLSGQWNLNRIQERKRAESKLEEMTNRFSLAARAGGVGIWDYDIVNNRLIWDDQMYRLYGITADRFGNAYEVWKAGLHPEDLARGDAEDQAALSGEKDFDTEFRVVWPDGSIHSIRALASVQRDASGQPMRMTGTNWDITELKQAEAALLASETMYRELLNHQGEGFAMLDAQERFLLVNPVAEEIFGVPPGGLLGRTLMEFLPLDQQDLVHRESRLRAKGTQSTYEFLIRREDGAMRTLLVTATPRPDLDGEALQVIGVFRDITERKQAEEALLQEQQFSRSVMDALPGIFYLYTYPGIELVLWNKHHESMLGYEADEMKGRLATDWFAPELKEAVFNAIEGVMERGENSIEAPMTAKDGHQLPLFLTGVKFESHGRLYFVGTGTDLTERNLAEEEKNKLRTQLQQSQKMESLGTLAGGVAHDMNNVLGAILGLASAHIGTQSYGSPLHKALDTICKATERGGKMVKSLLSFARQSPAENNKLDMNAILREQVALLERTTLVKVHLQLELEPDLRPILGDASALNHAIMNLCVNAVDAMPENGTLTLHTRHVDNDWVEVVVEDTGTGMPNEVLEKAMEPFFTTKETGRGTGLGLSMVFSTVKAHRGQMAIESEPGKGTRVRLRFPACEKESQATSPATAEATLIPKGSMKVLLVDDDELIQSSTKMLLEVLGHTSVNTAQSGEEALAMLEAGFEPDLVILDMNMPGLGGVGTLPRLRDLRPVVPILLATGRTDQTALALVSAHPGVTLLSKPFGLRELQKHLENIGLG